MTSDWIADKNRFINIEIITKSQESVDKNTVFNKKSIIYYELSIKPFRISIYRLRMNVNQTERCMHC